MAKDELVGSAGTAGASSVVNLDILVNLVEYLLFTISEVPPSALGRGAGSGRIGELSLIPFGRLREATAGFKLVEICFGALIGGRRDDFFCRRENPLLFSSIAWVLI